MMYYAVIYILLVNGRPNFMVEPVADLPTCRALATVVRMKDDPAIPDARCALIILDKDSQ